MIHRPVPPATFGRYAIGAALLLLLALAMFAYRLSHPTKEPAAAARRLTARKAVRPAEPPPAVEPLVLREMTPERARAFNATVPFARTRILPMPPIRFAGSAADREKAATCLAAASWWEAGDDPVGQRAVVQVVLNRLRHPAYPKTVCGVVFQGSERRTGCQFTFTCDGALKRVPSAVAWKRARAIADAALAGSVEKAVGSATSYHTDWVVPYWSASLEKITAIHTHLFFRWRGGWGRPAAFSGRYSPPESLDPRLAYLADRELLLAAGEDPAALPLDETAPAAGPRAALAVEGVSKAALKGNIVRLAGENGIGGGAEYGLELDRGAFPGSYALVALALCKTKPACIVTGWLRPEQIPTTLPMPLPAVRTASFLFRKNEQAGRERAYWNCSQFQRSDVSQCLPGTEPTRP